MPDTHWLRCGSLITGVDEEVLHDVAVGIQGELITDVRPWAELASAEQRSSRDLTDTLVTPGFIDAHVHLLFTCDIDHDVTRSRFETADTSTLAVTGARNAQECLLGGVTTVRDCGDTRGIVATIRDSQARGETLGPRILAAGAPLTTTGGHLHWCGNKADTADEIRKSVRSLCASGSDLVKVMSSGGNMTPESNALTSQYSAAELTIAVTEAHRFGKHVAAHAQNVESIRACVEAGVDTLEHCLWRNSDGSYAPTSELVELLEGSDAAVVITMAGIARVLLSSAHEPDPVMLAAGRAASPTGDLAADFAWGRALHEAGVNVVVASDAGVRFTPFRDFVSSVECTVEGLGVTPALAVAMSTSHAARAIGLADEIGSVVPGLRADLTVLRPSTNEGEIGTVRDVYQGGRLVVADGQLVVPALA